MILPERPQGKLGLKASFHFEGAHAVPYHTLSEYTDQSGARLGGGLQILKARDEAIGPYSQSAHRPQGPSIAETATIELVNYSTCLLRLFEGHLSIIYRSYLQEESVEHLPQVSLSQGELYS